MKRIAAILFAASLGAIAAGCTVEERVAVRERPPPRVEVVPPRPSPAHIWVGGHWVHERGDWVWIRGVWVIR